MRFLVALLLAALPAPGVAQDLRPAEPAVLYYFTIPLGADSRREREPRVGLAFQGRHHPVALRVDSRILNFLEGGVDAKVLIVGAVVVGAAALAGGKDSSVEAQRAQAAQRPPCTGQPAC